MGGDGEPEAHRNVLRRRRNECAVTL